MATDTGATTRATAEILSYFAHKIYLSSHSDGLKPSQWVALRYFSKTNPSASTLTAFADQIGCTKGTASRTVHHLIRRGLLKKTANPNDARSSLLGLTDEGRVLMAKDPIHDLESQLENLAGDEQRSLQELLARLMSPTMGND